MFCKVRDKVKELLAIAGAFRMQELYKKIHIAPDTWTMHACVNRLIEWGEIKEITDNRVAGQHRIFTYT